MKRYNITNDMQGGIKAVESNTGHWMLAGEVERMLEDVKLINVVVDQTDNKPIIYNGLKSTEKDNGN